MHTQMLSTQYALALVQLHGPNGAVAGLLLHSRSLVWAFDGEDWPLDSVAALAGPAAAAGLHQVGDPFADDLPPATAPWKFCLPGYANLACLRGPLGDITITREPFVSAAWWSTAVMAGGACRMLVAACVAIEPGDTTCTSLVEAAADGRVFGATIGVQLYPGAPR